MYTQQFQPTQLATACCKISPFYLASFFSIFLLFSWSPSIWCSFTIHLRYTTNSNVDEPGGLLPPQGDNTRQ